MTSKARFTQPSSGSSSAAQKIPGATRASVGASGLHAGSKRAAAKDAGHTTTATNVRSGGRIQVIYNGKIATPQSLIPRKTDRPHGDHAKKMKTVGVLKQPQTIDESESDNADKVTSGLTTKLSSKRNDPAGQSRMGESKFSMAFKPKVVVEESCTVFLSETPTQLLFFLPSFVVASDTRDVIHTEERNAKYENVIKSHKNVDGFSSRPTQTKNNQLKNQNEMAAPNAFREVGSQAVSYEIKDETCQSSGGVVEADLAVNLGVGTDTNEDLAAFTPSVRRFVNDTVGVALVTPGCLLDTTHAVKPPAPGEAREAKAKVTGPKGRSMMSVNKLGSSVVNTAASEAFSDDEGGGGGGAAAFHAAGRSQQHNANNQVSGTSSGNNSGQDVANIGVSGSRANNVSQSNADSAMESDDGGGGGGGRHYQAFTEEDSQQILREAETQKILASPMLLKRLHMIERAIQQNANYRSQLDYRDLPDISPLSLMSADRAKLVDSNDQLFGGSGIGGLGGKSALSMKRNFADRSKSVSYGAHLGADGGAHLNDAASVHSMDDVSIKDGGGAGAGGAGGGRAGKDLSGDPASKVKKLFSYSNAELIQDRSVTAMAWNSASTDLLAVSYGRTSDILKNPADALSDEAQEGLVLFWSLRNPDFPEKILRTSHNVTALEFSRQHPMILAVGLANGDVNIYDVKREGANWGVPMESSAGMSGGHLYPVWQVKWIVKGVERLETLVTISTDGRVLEWNLKKGLVVSTLMQLKKSGTGEGWISNASAGLCFDFHPSDPTTYVTGTEDGSLYKCSISYNEQYLETYQPHEGPIYRIRFSPRWSNVFLTSSADWNINLYHMGHKAPLLSMRATGECAPINDISWCPDNSTVFACVTADAKLQIWDLAHSSIDPVATLDIGEIEDKEEEAEEVKEEETKEEVFHALPSTPALPNRFDASGAAAAAAAAEASLAPVARLLRNLAVPAKRRVLTTVLFGEKTPVVVVGDDRGTVNVYRIFDPPLVTLLGPLQQFDKLKGAVIKQTDPSHAAALEKERLSVEDKA